MKKLFFLTAVLSISYMNSQVYSGRGDTKIQVGSSLQERASGINFSYDRGIGENMSFGVSSSYALDLKGNVIDAEFLNRFDLKGRFNANIGNIINVDDNLDVYPGLNVSLKNFGGHLGVRYFFSDGFGVYSEFNMPLSIYDRDLSSEDKLFNQFTVNIGAVFNI